VTGYLAPGWHHFCFTGQDFETRAPTDYLILMCSRNNVTYNMWSHSSVTNLR